MNNWFEVLICDCADEAPVGTMQYFPILPQVELGGLILQSSMDQTDHVRALVTAKSCTRPNITTTFTIIVTDSFFTEPAQALRMYAYTDLMIPHVEALFPLTFCIASLA